MRELRTGRSHVWVERNARENGPFNIKKIDGQLVTIERCPTGVVEVLDCGDDPHFIVPAANSHSMLTREAPIVAYPETNASGKSPWTLMVYGKDITKAVAGNPDVVPVAGARKSSATFRSWDAMASFARAKLGVTGWARERFGGWVPAGDWRAKTEGLPCTRGGCDKVRDRDDLCKIHANGLERRVANDEAREARVQEYRAERNRHRQTWRNCEETLERLRPLLAELGIHPSTTIVADKGDRVGILLPAEAAERLVRVAAGDFEALLAD